MHPGRAAARRYMRGALLWRGFYVFLFRTGEGVMEGFQLGCLKDLGRCRGERVAVRIWISGRVMLDVCRLFVSAL